MNRKSGGALPRRLSMALALGLLCFAPWVARAAANHPRHEVWLGFGGATSLEKGAFNTPNDFASSPEAAFSHGYLMNLDARRAVGIHLYGGTERVSEFPVQSPAGSQLVTFDLDTYNLGIRYRHSFGTGTMVPYAFVGGSVASGIASGSGLGNLTYIGASACAGPGASIRLARNFMISAEGFGSFGVANWNRAPLAISSGRKFNPSLAGGLVNLSVAWGTTSPSGARPASPVVRDSSAAAPWRASQIILAEACILLYSSAAYDDETGTLPGLTLGGGLLGLAAGQDWKSPKSPWILLAGILGISTAEFVMANNGGSQTALFVTSLASWNAVALVVAREERRAGKRR